MLNSELKYFVYSELLTHKLINSRHVSWVCLEVYLIGLRHSSPGVWSIGLDLILIVVVTFILIKHQKYEIVTIFLPNSQSSKNPIKSAKGAVLSKLQPFCVI